VILAKNQERSQRNKAKVGVGKNKYIKLDKTHYCIEKFNIAFSLCGVLVVAFYFPKVSQK